MSVEIFGSDAKDSEPLNLTKPKQELGEAPAKDVKQTLKSLIRSRRIAEGKSEIEVDLEREKPKCELTPEEKTRQRERKEQNRKAAMRCRERKKRQLQVLQLEEDQLRERCNQLKRTLQELAKQKESLLLSIRSSGSKSDTCVCSSSSCELNSVKLGVNHLSTRNHPSVSLSHTDSNPLPHFCNSSKGFNEKSDSNSNINGKNQTNQNSSYESRKDFKRKKYRHEDLDLTSENSESDDDYLLIDMDSEDSNQDDEHGTVLDLSCSNKLSNLETSESDSQPISSQDSVDSQTVSWNDDSDSHFSVSHDDDQLLSSQESQPVSSQDSIDGRFMKHGCRHCDTGITVNN